MLIELVIASSTKIYLLLAGVFSVVTLETFGVVDKQLYFVAE